MLIDTDIFLDPKAKAAKKYERGWEAIWGPKPEPPPVDWNARCVSGEAVAPGVPNTDDRGDGQQKGYVILCAEERAKGFVRPVRRSYIHVGPRGPRFPLRELTADESERYAPFGYVKHEDYPESERPLCGRFWTAADLARIGKGCGSKTTMGQSIAETYAREPHFYGSTFCCTCGTHLPVGAEGEFVWADTEERVGT